MVNPGRSSYRKASQRGPRGGKTRTEQLRDKLRERHRRLRENGLTPLKFHTKPIKITSGFPDDPPVRWYRNQPWRDKI